MKIIISIALLSFVVFTGVLLYDNYENKKILSEKEELEIKQEALIRLYEATFESSPKSDSLLLSFNKQYGTESWTTSHIQKLTGFMKQKESDSDTNLDFESQLVQFQIALSAARDTIQILEDVNADLFAEKEYIIDDFLKSREELNEELMSREVALTQLESKSDSLRNIMQVSEKEKAEVIKFKSPSGVEITYFGQIKSGKPHGEGIGLYANGNKYEGEWSEGQKHGRGKYTFPNGEYYDGKFVNNQREGYGQYFWPNGDVYVGFWLNDRRHGKGVIKDYTGKVISTGEWVNDALSKTGDVNF